MKITVMKQIKFCAGHRLVGHEGKCANLHGHNYIAQIHVTGNEVDQLGRVVDFAVINRLFKGWIDDNWDHGMLLWEEGTEAIKALNSISTSRTFLMPYNPTAENMARYLLFEVAPDLVDEVKGYDIAVSKVVIWETENSAAEVSFDSKLLNYVAAENTSSESV